MTFPIEYTQHTVAWPQLPVSHTEPWHTDELLLSSARGEMGITFMRFHDQGSNGVQMHVFGDGLDLFYDERIQRVMDAWRASDRDNATPSKFIAWLETEGAVPSSYHREGMERSPEETKHLIAMRESA